MNQDLVTPIERAPEDAEAAEAAAAAAAAAA
jgi:hypothetical protein